MEDLRIVVDGVALSVRADSGKKDGILLLHYGGGNLEMWEPVVSRLRNAYRCVRLDLRGHGRSDAPPSGYSFVQMARDVEGVMDALRLDRAHIVGSSLGAEVGLALAATCPERVSTLTCEGAFHSEYGPYGIREAVDVSSDEEIQAQRAAARSAPESSYESLTAFLAHAQRVHEACGAWNETMEAVAARNALEREDGRFVHAWRPWARHEYMDHYYAARFEEYYAAVECPTLILPGEREAADPMISDAMTGFSRLVDRCEIVHVPGAVHPFGWLSLPEEMSQTVLNFLDEFRD